MKRHIGLGLLLGFGCAACATENVQPPPVARVVREVGWVDMGVWLKADLHTHTNFSDGSHTVDEVVAAAAMHGCDAVAITDHTDEELKAATPEYLDAIRTARLRHPDIVVITGIEWNVPPGKGAEHAGVLFPRAMETPETLGLFKTRYDDWHKKGENSELAAEGLRSLANVPTPVPPVAIFNHPSREPDSLSAPSSTLEALRRSSDVLVGFEGAPGHQRASPVGAFKGKVTPVDRWDPLVAEPGGVWDKWLQRGLDVWGAIANSDFHEEKGDFWPCEFAATWIYAPDRTNEGILRALRAGSMFAEHGHIVTRAELEASAPGVQRPIIPGETVQMPAGMSSEVTLHLSVPELDYRGGMNRIETVELIGVSAEGAKVLFSGAPSGAQAFSLPVNVPTGGLAVRARGQRSDGAGGHFLFYTNPIRFVTP